jgi:hypothetical protein
MLSYILQAMSADREFGAALNEPLPITVPVKWNVQGSAADFMIVVSHADRLKVLSVIEYIRVCRSVNLLYRHYSRLEPSLSCFDCYDQ